MTQCECCIAVANLKTASISTGEGEEEGLPMTRLRARLRKRCSVLAAGKAPQATMRATRMFDAMKGTELPAAAPGLPSRSAEGLSRADEAGVILPRKCSRGASTRRYRRMPSITTVAIDITSAPIRAEPNGSKVVENFALKFDVFRLLWFQTITGRRFRVKQSEQECYESG